MLFVALEWYGTTSAVSWLFLLASCILGLVVAAGAYALWNRRGLKLHLELSQVTAAPGSPIEWLPEQILRAGPHPPIFEGDQMTVEVGVDATQGARGPAQVTGALGGQELSHATGLVPRSGWRQQVALSGFGRGVLSADRWEVITSDFLGFFRHRQRSVDFEVGLVFPKFVSLDSRRRVQEMEASVATTRAGAGTELFGVREHQPGDPLRRIHWRSSARRGQLIVREYEPPGLRTQGIYVDASPDTPETAAQIARIAASEAWGCIREGGRVLLWAPGTEPSQSPFDLWAQLEWLARYPEGGRDPWGWIPSIGDEVVFVTAGGDQQVIDAAEVARNRGARVRGWVIGDANLDVDAEVQRAGLEWPL